MWRLSYQNGSTEVIFFINLRPPVVYWPYSPSYDSSNFPIYEICSWKMAIDDLKIAAIILYIGSPLGNIYSKYAIVYCEYNLHFIIYMLVSDIVHVWFGGSNMQYIYQKWSDICIKLYLSYKQRSAVGLNLSKPQQ